ncbi:hypothetical protein LX32DRAFT_673320 [Colletotrichum zoysiae]|uniref:Hypersensitive response-inducing protein n=1 Tax=Colletotrichum zoysiae TaxID=1216348 RepID=A0AAD9HJ52_9PEZI|nr:hypothetical protein LX32DRAFT_673320 [Colletotrichum zoysiae]
MRSALFVRIITCSAFIAYAVAKSCCWTDMWSDSCYLHLKWDEPAGVVRCGLVGTTFPPDTKCSVENSKDASGNIQALTNVTFGNGTAPFQFRIGVNPDTCATLPADKVTTGWEGWGSYLFKNDYFSSQDVNVCVQDHSA